MLTLYRSSPIAAAFLRTSTDLVLDSPYMATERGIVNSDPPSHRPRMLYPTTYQTALGTTAIVSGERSQNTFESTDKYRNLSVFQWHLLFFVGRMSREFDPYDPHCAIFLFLTRGTMSY